ncbi:MAG: hypothetical protein KAV87_54850 [Desulfobacteraceae bacterium]|nr:hypothetical protein [Desulfobacteraceae bacterium]
MMNKKISKLPISKKQTAKKKTIETLRLKYPRIERSCKEFQPIPPEEKKYYWAPDGKQVLRLTDTLAHEGYQEFATVDLSSLVEVKLSQVIYRTLKAIYGRPDIIAGWRGKKFTSAEGKPSIYMWPIEWGYLLKEEDGCIFDIFSRCRDHEPHITLWLSDTDTYSELPVGTRKGFNEFLVQFSELAKRIDNEYSIKNETKEIKGFPAYSSIRFANNLYYQNIQSAKDIVQLADEVVPVLDRTQDNLWAGGRRYEAFDQWRKKSLFYVSSILFSLMALEGFINLLYKFFLLSKYSHEQFKRLTEKGDLDLRILHLPTYCKCFSNASITPDSPLYEKLIAIRKFRNDLVHANITVENEGYLMMEDMFFFEYNPLFHTSSRTRRKKKPHTQQLAFGKGNAIWMVQRVEEIVNDIISEMDEGCKSWVRTWINAGRIAWIPGSEDYKYLSSLNQGWEVVETIAWQETLNGNGIE